MEKSLDLFQKIRALIAFQRYFQSVQILSNMLKSFTEEINIKKEIIFVNYNLPMQLQSILQQNNSYTDEQRKKNAHYWLNQLIDVSHKAEFFLRDIFGLRLPSVLSEFEKYISEFHTIIRNLKIAYFHLKQSLLQIFDESVISEILQKSNIPLKAAIFSKIIKAIVQRYNTVQQEIQKETQLKNIQFFDQQINQQVLLQKKQKIILFARNKFRDLDYMTRKLIRQIRQIENSQENSQIQPKPILTELQNSIQQIQQIYYQDYKDYEQLVEMRQNLIYQKVRKLFQEKLVDKKQLYGLLTGKN